MLEATSGALSGSQPTKEPIAMVRTTIVAAVLLTVTSLVSAQPAPIAHYPLFSDGVDITGHQAEMTMVNTPFQDYGVYCNGVYQDYTLHTSNLIGFDPELFAVQCIFKCAGFSGWYLSPQAIIIGGIGYRWVGAGVDEFGQLYTLHNNFNHTPTGSYLQLDTWYNLVLCYDGAQDAMKVYLDENLVFTLNDFVPVHGNDFFFSAVNYGNGMAHHGIIRDLKIYAAAEVPVALQPTTWSRVKALY